ncbi:TetR/AcrR family transcriptional regulator [Phytohabitans rumicis]|uniref:TetR family transcriptional regulator n=1 Tax=Phytohabitans rumicis TaxID=1076125 RepID=A0A6V8L0B3_9ACTN|nr:TetR/AcrR family transcriptional regulator [Phytohabitans rumicis]GFJ90772.1 TetR family transcriptional regulator [Phytohabitans rumicis]
MVSTDGRLARGERTRTAVLDTAVALATQSGLDGLSLAQLAEALGVSKSGLFAHWRSKQDLQLATVERAREQWQEQVIAPARTAPRGARRLWALHVSRLDFYASQTLPGRCFFANAKFEYNARSGPVYDRIAQTHAEWMEYVELLARQAVEQGELRPDTDVAMLAYEVEAVGVAAVMQYRLLSPEVVYPLAWRVVLERLRGLCTDPTLLPEA